MFNGIILKIQGWALVTHIVAAGVAFAVMQAALALVNGFYARSGHPVSFFEGQTAFSADAIKGWYAHMIDAGTMNIYVQTQLVDYVFIATVALFGVVIGTLAMRLAGDFSLLAKNLGFAVLILFVAAASSDAIENLISFVMLSDPLNFDPWLAFPYSGFAVLKFACLAAGFASLATSVLLTAVQFARLKFA